LFSLRENSVFSQRKEKKTIVVYNKEPAFLRDEGFLDAWLQP